MKIPFVRQAPAAPSPVPHVPAPDDFSDHIEVALPLEYPYFPVGTFKFAVMSIATFGIYDLYWFWQNWKRIRNRTGDQLSPFWRAMFSPLWGFSLAHRVYEHAARARQPANWDATLLGALYLVLYMSHRLPDPWWLVCLFAFAPLVPILQTTRRINASAPAAEGDNQQLSVANILTIIVGELVFLLIAIGMFLPDEAG